MGIPLSPNRICVPPGLPSKQKPDIKGNIAREHVDADDARPIPDIFIFLPAVM